MTCYYVDMNLTRIDEQHRERRRLIAAGIAYREAAEERKVAALEALGDDLSVAEVARLVGVSRRSLYAWMQARVDEYDKEAG